MGPFGAGDEMTGEVVAELIGGVLDIVRRHFTQTGEILTDEQAFAMLRADVQEGQSAIAKWFAEKGRPFPA